MNTIIDYDSPSFLKTFLESRGFAMQKKFGQNFLINRDARKKLIDALELDSTCSVWEIGPGLGAMTAALVESGANVSAFEIDRGFASVLKEVFGDAENFSLIEGDVLKTWKKHAESSGAATHLFGNLPYNIAATVFADFIEHGVRFEKAVITVQKEVAQRMCAKVGSADYSSFSLLCQWAYEVKPVMDLGPSSFWPRPNVDSRAVRFVKRNDWPGCKDPVHFAKMQRALFSSRRKTVKNNLTAFLKDGEKAARALEDAAIDPQIRAEKLSLTDVLRLSDCVVSCDKP